MTGAACIMGMCRLAAGDRPCLAARGGRKHGIVQLLPPVSLEYATGHLLAAVGSIARSDAPMPSRLQSAWDESVQLVWEKPCLTRDLLADFKSLWGRYTAPSSDRRTTQLRDLSPAEVLAAIDELLDLAVRTAIAAAQAPPDIPLATLADLQ